MLVVFFLASLLFGGFSANAEPICRNIFFSFLPSYGRTEFSPVTTRLLFNNGYEINFEPGNFDGDLNLRDSFLMIGGHGTVETRESATKINSPPTIDKFHKVELALGMEEILFTQKLTPGDVKKGILPITVRIELKEPFDGKDLNPKNFATFELLSGDGLLIDSNNRPVTPPDGKFIVLSEYGPISVTYTKEEAQQLSEVVALAKKFEADDTTVVVDLTAPLPFLRPSEKTMIYRKHLAILPGRQKTAILTAQRPLEVGWVLSGLEALGLNPNHPIFKTHKLYRFNGPVY